MIGDPSLLGMRGGDEADAAETPAARFDHRLWHLFDRGAEGEVGVEDDAGADLRSAIGPDAAIATTLLANSISPTAQLNRARGAATRGRRSQ